MNGFTPGPWTYGVEADGETFWVRSDEFLIVELPSNGQIDERAEDDARLIAAAPDLLAACEAAIEEFRQFMTAGDTLTKCEAAVAKAMSQGGGRHGQVVSQ